jgi:hypothetical protein
MKFEIHYSIGDYDDSLIIEGDTIEEIRGRAKIETDRRGLTEDKNNLWSREI